MHIYRTSAFRTSVVVMAVFAMSSSASDAQSLSSGRRNFESRAELDSQARQAEASQRPSDAALIRSRLQRGDFQLGDRILVTVEGIGGFSDTLTVEADQRLPVPQLGELRLAGILRSELVPSLKAHVATFLKSATVRATPLVRLAVLGSVAKPGFYYTFADVPISDILMAAGGPTADADLAKVQIRRGTAVILAQGATRTAMAEGMSVDMLHLRAGDEIDVGKKRQFSGTTVLSILGGLVSLVVGIVTISR